MDRHGENAVGISYARESAVEEIAPGRPPASEWREEVKGKLVSVMQHNRLHQKTQSIVLAALRYHPLLR